MEARKLKFRAYRKISEEMLEVFSFCDDFVKVKIKGQVLKYRRIEFEPLMQFTGLLDSQGKEIYEGDIVSDNRKSLLINWDVRFNNGSFTFWNKDSQQQDVDTTCYEIIGNIYESTPKQ
jgi:hypothetical protein